MTQPAQQPPKVPKYLRPKQKQILEETVRTFESVANSPYVTGDISRKQARDAAERARKDLESQTAPVLSKAEEDRFSKRAQQLQEQFTKDMLPDEDMRRNPYGAVDKHIQWERQNKAAILEWKAIQIALHPGADHSTTQDLCNIERLRRPTDPSRNYNDAQIPRSNSPTYSMPPQQLGPKAGWPYVTFESLFDESPQRVAAEALEAQEAELEELRARLARLESQGGKVIEQDVSKAEQKDLSSVQRNRPGSNRRG